MSSNAPAAADRVSARTNLKDVVADHLRELIFSGRLRPEDRIDQDEIADRAQVSKLPVREALILLESEGLVRNIPRRGSFVNALTKADIRDHYRIYALVSGIAAERAATDLSDDELQDLSELLEQLEGTQEAGAQEELNHRFHRQINRAGGSLRLRSAIHGLSRTMPSHFYEFASGWGAVANQQHRRIMEALLDRDSAAAGTAMVEHLVSGGDYAVDMLEHQGFWGQPSSGQRR